MECAEVNGADGKIGIKVDSLASLVGVSRSAGLVVEALVTDGDEVVGIDGLDIRRNLFDPRRDGGSRASASACSGAARASGLVRKLPSHDGGLVEIAGDKSFDIVLVGRLHGGISIEKVVIGRVQDLLDVNIHAAVVRPIVGQSNDESKAISLCSGDDVIEVAQTG